jgi:hypothetical protein
MKFNPLNEPSDVKEDAKLNDTFNQFADLIRQYEQKNLSDKSIQYTNERIDEVNASGLNGKALRKLIRKVQFNVIRFIEKDSKIVPKNHYRRFWMLMGMSAFGVPIGMGISYILDGQIGNFGIGLPLGMGVGILLGSLMDKKAAKEGRQLAIEAKPY